VRAWARSSPARRLVDELREGHHVGRRANAAPRGLGHGQKLIGLVVIVIEYIVGRRAGEQRGRERGVSGDGAEGQRREDRTG